MNQGTRIEQLGVALDLALCPNLGAAYNLVLGRAGGLSTKVARMWYSVLTSTVIATLFGWES